MAWQPVLAAAHLLIHSISFWKCCWSNFWKAGGGEGRTVSDSATEMKNKAAKDPSSGSTHLPPLAHHHLQAPLEYPVGPGEVAAHHGQHRDLPCRMKKENEVSERERERERERALSGVIGLRRTGMRKASPCPLFHWLVAHPFSTAPCSRGLAPSPRSFFPRPGA